jgi:hypothetical protein
MQTYLIKHRLGLRLARVGFASLAALIAAKDLTGATTLRNEQSVESRPIGEPIMAAREAARAAETARVAAAETAPKAARGTEPISVFISRKTQRLYIRQALQPILEIPVTIEDADRPIGTHIFTALEHAGAEMRWSVVSLIGGHQDNSGAEINNFARKNRGGDGDTIMSDLTGAKAALDRVTIPLDTIDRIAEMVTPRSSLIISDEALSPETGNGTEFVVVMSGEPQGGLKHRQRAPQFEVRYDRMPYWRSPMASPYYTWWR